MGFTTKETLLLLLVTNRHRLGRCAFLFGQVQDRIGHKATLAINLVLWIGTVLLVWAAQGATVFWIAANLVGICLGASQSAGSALVGYLSPERHIAEFFGLWGLAVKLSSIIGPVTYGLVSWLSHGDHRLAILMTSSFFVVGLALLFTVNIAARPRDRRAMNNGGNAIIRVHAGTEHALQPAADVVRFLPTSPSAPCCIRAIATS